MIPKRRRMESRVVWGMPKSSAARVRLWPDFSKASKTRSRSNPCRSARRELEGSGPTSG